MLKASDLTGGECLLQKVVLIAQKLNDRGRRDAVVLLSTRRGSRNYYGNVPIFMGVVVTHGSTVTSYARKYSFKESMREDLKVIADTCLAHC
jgi:hypothetical protein